MLKSFLVKTSLYRHLLHIRSFLQLIVVRFYPKRQVDTVYCISPYKTGTTYFSGIFRGKVSHEPLMHSTLLNMDRKGFLERRAAYLSLDLECSGFFANKIDVLSRALPGCKFVFLIRHPESWIGSVVNYFAKLDGVVSYNYVPRMIFDPICEYPVERFYSLSQAERVRVVEGLLKYWISVYSNAKTCSDALIVPLDEIEGRIDDIKEFTGLEYIGEGQAWKRKNDDKKKFLLSDYVDCSLYRDEVSLLGYELD